ncbi:MAG TPA: hypothetical protein PKI05_13460 [Thermogutta sp.]|nr:hypothetical protein [Thermogutta sp.]
MDDSIYLTALERAVMEMLLAGDHPVLAVLRAQFDRAKVAQSEFSGVGFFTHFEVPPDVPRLRGRKSFELGDVHADIPGLSVGVGFILFIREGAIDFLEGFTYGDDRWHDKIEQYTLCYEKNIGGTVVPAAERDWESLRKKLEEL